MRRHEESYYYPLWEILYHETSGAHSNIIEIEALTPAWGGFGGPLSRNPRLMTIYNWALGRLNADNTLINGVLAILQGENPLIYVSEKETLTVDERAEISSRFYDWLWKGMAARQMQYDALNKTAAQLLGDVKSTITMERKIDTDTGKDVSATSDMPITSTFSGALADPTTLSDRLSELQIAQRDYSHKWKDETTSENPMATLPARIQEVLDTYRSIIEDWADEFMETFSITPEEDML